MTNQIIYDRKRSDVMIDLETMGTNTCAPIVSIGAVFFSPESEELGPTFYVPVNLRSSMLNGGIADGDTILWWLKQSKEARAAICTNDALDIKDALFELSHFITCHACNLKKLKVWGNGATFDNVILRGAYERVGLACPWEYFNDQDVRTILILVSLLVLILKKICHLMANDTMPWLMLFIRLNMYPQFSPVL